MSVQLQILEYSQAPVKDGVIRGVKIVGTRSRNGRVYPQSVLNEAMPLYEASAVYIWHPDAREKKQNSRRHDDYFGHLLNVHERFDGKIGLGLFGDLHVRQSHPMAQLIVESTGKEFGLSHNVIVEMNDDKTEVTKILEVNSVDLVDDPATTTNLFEDTDMELKEMQETVAKAAKETEGKLTTLLEEKIDALQKQVEGFKEAQTKTEAENQVKPPKRVALLEKADVVPGAPAIGNTHEDFLGALRGFQTTN